MDPGHRLLSTDPSVRQAYSEDASGLIGLPDAVARPENEQEIVEIVRHCLAHQVPITPQGLRSSTVGGPLSFGGVAMSFERMARTIDVDVDRRIAIVEPGVNLGEFKRTLSDLGLFYPPDPTSENECTVGGSVLTNASGSRSYRYGPTRPYVRSLRLVLGDGSLTEIARSRAAKNTVGYFAFQDPVDLIVGSEGTLGIVTRITLDLRPAPPGFFSGMAFFLRLADALAYVVGADRARREGIVEPRCLELFDDASLDLIRTESGPLKIPREARAAILFEQECEPGAIEDELQAWFTLIENYRGLIDDTIITSNETQHLFLRKLRHALPTSMDEAGKKARSNGGLRLSTDWAVPLDVMPRAIDEATRITRETFGGLCVRFGHVGSGHPHFNLVAESPADLEKAREATHRMAVLAVERGGTVMAEHGVGKVKREYLRYQYPTWVVDGMRALKRTLDPGGILAPGNIFE